MPLDRSLQTEQQVLHDAAVAGLVGSEVVANETRAVLGGH
jgi:hypothetical protein